MNDYDKAQRIKNTLDNNTGIFTKCHICAYYYKAGGCKGKEHCTVGIVLFMQGKKLEVSQ